jgi:hypothetical protein
MPAEMLTDRPNGLDRGVEIEGVLDLGAREVNQADHALRPTSRMSPLLRPRHLTHGIVGNELRPNARGEEPSSVYTPSREGGKDEAAAGGNVLLKSAFGVNRNITDSGLHCDRPRRECKRPRARAWSHVSL